MAKRPKRVFFAYPAGPSDLTSTIDAAAGMTAAIAPHVEVVTWPQMDTFGAVIPDRVIENIDNADVLFCDFTVANPNVYYEFGYAIGKGKSVGVVINASFDGAVKSAQSDGLFDTIGYKVYENSQQLADLLSAPPNTILIDLYAKSRNGDQPIYVLDTFRKTDFRNIIVSSVKGSKSFYRSFDPVETPRFSSVSIIGEVSASDGVVVPFLEMHIEDARRHNLRASFLAGLAVGLQKVSLLIRHKTTEGTPTPADYRESVKTVGSNDEITYEVNNFAAAAAAVQRKSTSYSKQKSPLQQLRLGASAAENEFRTLQNYFVQTAEYLRCARGEINVVAGRKGSGKTAIFYQVRDNARRTKNNIIVDLKPESHQLSIFREEMLKIVGAGVFDHTISAMWYFLILTELLLTIRHDLERTSRLKPGVVEKINSIDAVCRRFQITQSGDFTFRINRLSSTLIREVLRLRDTNETVTAERLTNIVFAQGIPELRSAIERLTSSDSELWFLFDNIDKGWPATGLDEFDARMVRLLVEALNKTQRDFHNIGRTFIPIVFVRNDVLELMVSETPDRNKWAQISIDWSDRPKLRQVIYERLRAFSPDKSASFEQLWTKNFCDVVRGQNSFDYFVDHSLMRPRFLINIIEYAISNAINRGNETVSEEDCIDAVCVNANYLVDDFGYEIRDVSKLSSDILYSLLGISALVTKDEVLKHFKAYDVPEDRLQEAFDLVLWYGIIGVADDASGGKYIYDFEYSMRRLQAEIRRFGTDLLYVTNPAVHVALAKKGAGQTVT